jgi:hypothetical protein
VVTVVVAVSAAVVVVTAAAVVVALRKISIRRHTYPPAISCRYVWFWFTHQ